MPTKAEHRHRYPPDWRAIRAAILERADHCCEFCWVPNKTWRNNQTQTWTRNKKVAERWIAEGYSVTRIVLTIAYLDHPPEHNDSANLRALCQRCYLAHDQDPHRQSAYWTRRDGKALGDLFPTPNTQAPTPVNS